MSVLAHRPLHADAPDDVRALQRVHDHAAHYSQVVHGRAPDGSEALETLTGLPPGHAPEDKRVLGFFLDGVLVGCADVLRGYPEPGTAWIGLLLFQEAHQGRGLGRAALERIEALAADWGCSAIQLAVIETNVRGHAFWRREGFAEVRRKSIPGVTGAAIVMGRAHPAPAPVCIRPATGGDAQNLAALAIQVFLHTYATSGIRTALSGYALEAFTPATMLALVQDPGHRLLVAEAAGHLLGFADLDLLAPRAEVPGVPVELATLYVQEHFIGTGIGSRLFSACAEQARAACGVPRFWLSVYAGNARALAFYRKHGLTRRASFPFEFGGERHENYVMA